MSFWTGTSVELLYQSTVPGTAKNTFTTEAVINDTAGMGPQPVIQPYWWDPTYGKAGKTLLIIASGILSTTSAPTFTWTIRLGSAASTAGPLILGSTALTAATTVTNKLWSVWGTITMKTLGATGGNSTVVGIGQIESPAGLASPFSGEMWGGAAQPGTVATVDISIANYVNFNAACGTSSVSNAIQLLSLSIFGCN